MSIVAISIHKHGCAICGCLFMRRTMSDVQEGCMCSAATSGDEYVELCPACQAKVDEAGWLGILVAKLVERTVSLNRRLEAIEPKQEAS